MIIINSLLCLLRIYRSSVCNADIDNERMTAMNIFYLVLKLLVKYKQVVDEMSICYSRSTVSSRLCSASGARVQSGSAQCIGFTVKRILLAYTLFIWA